ncbi:hypothetical protein ACFQL4_24560 [Halosimplex aquaticum]
MTDERPGDADDDEEPPVRPTSPSAATRRPARTPRPTGAPTALRTPTRRTTPKTSTTDPPTRSGRTTNRRSGPTTPAPRPSRRTRPTSGPTTATRPPTAGPTPRSSAATSTPTWTRRRAAPRRAPAAPENVGAPDDEEMPLAEHIEEMVRRLGVVIVVMALVSGLAFPFADRMINFLWYSFCRGRRASARRPTRPPTRPVRTCSTRSR